VKRLLTATALRRGAIVACAAGACVFFWLDWRRRHPPDFEVIDVGGRARALSAASPEADTLGEVYFWSPDGQVHLHVFGKGSTCHLHLHEHTEEATIPVWTAPRVTQRFGADGAIAEKAGRYEEGTLIVSFPNCAHQWENVSATDGHASLVFTLGGPFPGNLFVAPDDARILGAAPPFVLDSRSDLAAFATGPWRMRETRVPVTMASVAEVLLKSSYVIAAQDGVATFIYATAGKGRIEGGPKPVALSPTVLVIERKPVGLTLVADGAEPLAAFVARIPEKRP
jgi:hypothetical protein